ncbi:hypothetical protein G6F53_013905 [Rhizopus delemar]|nr:hypothetical protein G6F53_013905 [Rhizopus delemar]
MALRDQVADQFAHRGGLVHAHADAAFRVAWRDAGEGNVLLFQVGQHHLIVGQWWNQHDAVRARVLEQRGQVGQGAAAGADRPQDQLREGLL